MAELTAEQQYELRVQYGRMLQAKGVMIGFNSTSTLMTLLDEGKEGIDAFAELIAHQTKAWGEIWKDECAAFSALLEEYGISEEDDGEDE